MATTKWVIDPSHSEVSFKVKHLMITNVKGVFKTYEGSVTTEGADLTGAQVSFTAQVGSLDTNSADRDTHLKSADFFDAENHPTLSFVATSITKKDDDAFAMTGDLTLRGVTHPVTLDVQFEGAGKDPWGNEKASYSISGKIDRKDWGLKWNVALEAGGLLVSDDVRISADIQLLKQA